jgi:hypothetical protein
MSKLHPSVWRLAKYVIPLAGLVPVAFGISVALEKLAPEKAQAALNTVPAVQSVQRETATSTAKVALLIANAQYPDANAPLNHAVKDSQALADQLRRSGFEVDVRENLGKDEMTRAFETFKGKIKPGTVALVSFSGFGIQADRQSYLIPVNAQIWRETDVKREGVSIDSVLADMHERGASVKLAIVDASRRNPFERRFRAYSAGLAAIDAPLGTLLMSAAAPGKVAYDGPSENSLLISELLKEIVLPGQSAEAVFNHTRLGVSRASNGEQVPQVSSSLTGNFTFVAGNGRVASLNRDTMIDEPRVEMRVAPRVEPRQTFEPADTSATNDALRTGPGETAADAPGVADERPAPVTTEKKVTTETPAQSKLQSRPATTEKPSATEKPARIAKTKKPAKYDDDEVVPRRRYSDPEWSYAQPRPFFGQRRHSMFGGSPFGGGGGRPFGRIGLGY